VLSLADAAAVADGVGPLSEQVRLHLAYGGDPAVRNLLLRHGADLAGYAHLGFADPAEGRSGELVIHPAYRRRGLGLALARAVLAEESLLPVRIWAHGDLPAAARLAAATGFTRAGPVADAALAAGCRGRATTPAGHLVADLHPRPG